MLKLPFDITIRERYVPFKEGGHKDDIPDWHEIKVEVQVGHFNYSEEFKLDRGTTTMTVDAAVKLLKQTLIDKLKKYKVI